MKLIIDEIIYDIYCFLETISNDDYDQQKIIIFISALQHLKMGNECDQCEAITEGCKRDQFRSQLKNRQKLDLSKMQQLKSSNQAANMPNQAVNKSTHGSSQMKLQQDQQNEQVQIKKINKQSKKHIKQLQQIKQSKLQFINSPQQENQQQLNKQNAIGFINIKMKKTNTSVIDQYFGTNKNNNNQILENIENQNKKIEEFEIKNLNKNNIFDKTELTSKIDKKFNFQVEKKQVLHQNSTSQYDYEKFIKEEDDVIEQYQGLVKSNLAFQGFKCNGQIHNKGTFSWQDGTILKTQFKKGKIQNKVVVTFANQSIYEGAIKNYQANGQGRIICKDGSYYEGEWLDNLPHGKGKQKMSDGSLYEGQFQRGFKNGQGKFRFEDGTTYQGGFYSDKFSGQGKLQLLDRIYKGTFRDGYLQGQGQLIYKDGVKYIGNFKKSKKQGQGTYIYGDGREWSGQWKDNRQNGHGKYRHLNGEIVEGHWIDGVKSESKLRFN